MKSRSSATMKDEQRTVYYHTSYMDGYKYHDHNELHNDNETHALSVERSYRMSFYLGINFYFGRFHSIIFT